MSLSSVPWERNVIVSADAVAKGRLCPAMRRLPKLGSFFAEVFVAGIELMRKVLDIILVLPALCTCRISKRHALSLRTGTCSRENAAEVCQLL